MFTMPYIKLTLLICLIAGITVAQDDVRVAKVHGTVADPNQAVIPGASVTLKNLNSQMTFNTTTNDEGVFEFNGVKKGRYEVSAEIFWSAKYIEIFALEGEPDKEFHISLGPHECPDSVKRLPTREKRKVHFCSLHRVKLQLSIVPIEYGLVVLDDRDASTNFPHSSWVYYGGCVIDCYEKAEVLYCPKCRKAELEWQRKAGRDLR